MDDNSLFAELLVNKSKVKPLSASQINCKHSISNINHETNNDFYKQLNSIFVKHLSQNDAINNKQYEFLEFINNELPHIIIKFNKIYNGKND
jgi:hypothetical protein